MGPPANLAVVASGGIELRHAPANVGGPTAMGRRSNGPKELELAMFEQSLLRVKNERTAKARLARA